MGQSQIQIRAILVYTYLLLSTGLAVNTGKLQGRRSNIEDRRIEEEHVLDVLDKCAYLTWMCLPMSNII